jgi:outer membrane protein insertion porin family
MYSRRLLFTLSIIFSSTCLLTFFQTIGAQQTNQRIVEAVEVRGNRRVSTKGILKRIRTRPGEPFNVKKAQLDLEELLALGFFDKTQARVSTEEGKRGGIIVIFEVMELPIIKDVKIEGLRTIEESEIIEVLHRQQITLTKGAVYESAQIRKATRIIKEFLTSRYWSDVKVTIRMNIDSFNEVSLTIVIEGKDFSFIEMANNNSFNRSGISLPFIRRA